LISGDLLIILFKDERLQRELTNHKNLTKRHGAHRTRKIEQRLADLSAAPNLEIMSTLPGRCHELKGDLQGCLAVDLDHPYRMVFEAANDPIPVKPDGGLDRSFVTEIRILRIEDYHD